MSVIQPILKEVAGKMRIVQASRPKQDTRCRPDCPLCGGIGWIRNDLPLDHPDFGKMMSCPNVDLFQVYGDRLGIDPDERDRLTWNAVNPRQDTNILQAVQAVQATLDQGYGWVFLHGGVGLAKTLLMKIAITEKIKAGKMSAYARMSEVIEHMRRAYDKDHGQEEAEARLDFWAGLPVLALDEFDRLRGTPFGDDRKFLLLDRRYEDAAKKKTITLLASNANPCMFDDYLQSRINDGRFKVIEMTGTDFRPLMSY